MKTLKRGALSVLLAGYLYVLIKVILFKFGHVNISFLAGQLQAAIEHPARVMNGLRSGNFTPLLSIKQNLDRLSYRHDFVNLVGNIVIFTPFGMLVAMLAKRKFAGSVIASFGVSLALECAQILFSMGRFDVDDLILNTAGGLIGYVLYLAGTWFSPKKKDSPARGRLEAGTVRQS